MKKILFATGNRAKVKRFESQLLEHGIELVSLKDIDTKVEVEENGSTVVENALIKARAYYEETKITTFAMDDSLYLENVPDSLQPGMYVRRVGNKRLNDDEMLSYYSTLAHTYGENGKLTAKWIYGMALIKDGEEFTYTWSKNEFYLTDTPSSKIELDYPLNSISINQQLNKYFTDMTEEDKQLVKEKEDDVIQFIVEHS